MLQGSGSLGMGSGLSGATESESQGLEKAPFAWLAGSVSSESRGETLSESSRHPEPLRIARRSFPQSACSSAACCGFWRPGLWVRAGLAIEVASHRLAWLGSPGSLAQNILSSGETLGESVGRPSLPEPRPQVLPAVLAAAYRQCLQGRKGSGLGSIRKT